MTPIFKKTPRQVEATKLLAGPARHCMLYGGSRSGKTFNIIRAIIVRACKEQSRHAILRLKFNHAKVSIFLDTLPKVLNLCFPQLKVRWDKTDFYIELENGSTVWVGGLDDQERVEKILGREYSTLYFNECSQIAYKSIEIALTRLAEKNGLKKKAYYDENPPTKKHWSYDVFVKYRHPDTAEALDPTRYASMVMNPQDNIQNIDSEYISEVLDKLSDAERARFRDGLFADASDGEAYYAFQREVNVHPFEQKYAVGTLMIGMDFNVNPMTAVVGYYQNKIFFVMDELYLPNSDTPKMCNELIRRGYRGAWIFPDSTGKNRKTSGRSDHLILNENGFSVRPTRNPFVKDRVNNLNRLLRDGQIIIDPKCKKLIKDLEKVVWDGNDLDKKSDEELTHISDALGYWCWAIDSMVFKGLSPIEIS